MAKKELVLAFFENEAAADAAVVRLKQLDEDINEVKLGEIGVLVKDEKGKIKTHKLGGRKTGAGLALGALAGVLSGGLTVVAGVVAGGILGSLFHKGLGMSKEDLARISASLDGGKAAVAVLTEADEAAGVTSWLADLGGVTESHTVTEEALDQAAAASEDPAAE